MSSLGAVDDFLAAEATANATPSLTYTDQRITASDWQKDIDQRMGLAIIIALTLTVLNGQRADALVTIHAVIDDHDELEDTIADRIQFQAQLNLAYATNPNLKEALECYSAATDGLFRKLVAVRNAEDRAFASSFGIVRQVRATRGCYRTVLNDIKRRMEVLPLREGFVLVGDLNSGLVKEIYED